MSLCLQSSDVFLLVDNARGCRVFSYDGRTVSQPSASFLAPSNLKRGVVALSNDVIAVVDGNDRKKIHFVDVTRLIDASVTFCCFCFFKLLLSTFLFACSVSF